MVSPKDWLVFAENDLRTAKAALEDNIPSNACFLAQQTVEKSLKAIILAQNQEIPKTHDLLFLIKFTGLTEYKEKCEMLNKFYIPTRYPDATAGSLVDSLPSIEMAKQSIEYAQQIFDAIQSRLG